MPFNSFVFPLLMFLYNGFELYKHKTIVQFPIQFKCKTADYFSYRWLLLKQHYALQLKLFCKKRRETREALCYKA